jgi:hypothetical protein
MNAIIMIENLSKNIYIVIYMSVTIDGVPISNRIYCTVTERNYR